jgi:very-short-patch-repair endonuclease
MALERQGYAVFRFWSHEVKNELGQCVKQILDYIHRRSRPTYGH